MEDEEPDATDSKPSELSYIEQVIKSMLSERITINPLPDDKSISKLIADDNFKFDENGRKYSKRVENSGKRRNCSF